MVPDHSFEDSSKLGMNTYYTKQNYDRLMRIPKGKRANRVNEAMDEYYMNHPEIEASTLEGKIKRLEEINEELSRFDDLNEQKMILENEIQVMKKNPIAQIPGPSKDLILDIDRVIEPFNAQGYRTVVSQAGIGFNIENFSKKYHLEHSVVINLFRERIKAIYAEKPDDQEKILGYIENLVATYQSKQYPDIVMSGI